MNVNTHSEGHVGGTTPPTRWARGLSSTGISIWHAPDVVPQRAPQGTFGASESSESCGFWPMCPLRGTEGHDRPQLSVNDQRRA